MAHMSPRLKMKRGRFGLGGFKGPTLIINGPGGILLFGPGSPTNIGNFTGVSADDIQGDISSGIEWSVSGPGSPSGITLGSPILDTGASVNLGAFLDGPAAPGSPQFGPVLFTVVARSTDLGGNSITKTLGITVHDNVDYVPNLTFVSPASGSVFGPGSPANIPNFVGTAIDHEDGDISANIEWFVQGHGSPTTAFGSPADGIGASVDLSAVITAVGSPVFGSPLPGSPQSRSGSPSTRDFTVVARITDSFGNTRTESITVQTTGGPV